MTGAPEDVGGGLIGDRLVGEATDKEDKFRDNAAVFVVAAEDGRS